MPRDVHCPNPGCTHVFPAATMAGMAALVCPQCGGVFQVRRTSGRQADESSPSGTRRTGVPTPHGRRLALVWIMTGCVVFAVLGLGTVAFYRRNQPAAPTGPEPFRSTEHNYSFLIPGPPWQRDADLARRLGGVLAFRRTDPDAWAVLAVRS